MKAQTNRVVFERVIQEAFNQCHFEVLPELFKPDFIEHQFGLHPTITGLEADIRSLHRSFPDFLLTIEEISEQDDKLWARMTGKGTNTGGFMGRANGKSFEIAVFDLCRFENGKIAEHWGSPDRFALLAQLELLPRG